MECTQMGSPRGQEMGIYLTESLPQKLRVVPEGSPPITLSLLCRCQAVTKPENVSGRETQKTTGLNGNHM